MPGLKSLRWLSGTPRDIDDGEDSHELLSEHELSNRPVARWAKKRGASSFNTRIKIIAFLSVSIGLLAGFLIIRQARRNAIPEPDELPDWPWQTFTRLDGYYQGISKIVKAESWVAQNQNAVRNRTGNNPGSEPSSLPVESQPLDFRLFPYRPDLRDGSVAQDGSLPSVQQCFLYADDSVPAPSIYASEGIPQNSAAPIFGLYDVLQLRDDVCFERYGRLGPYGLGYSIAKGGNGLGMHGDQSLTDSVWSTSGYLNWSSVDLGAAQRRCAIRNQKRYHSTVPNHQQTPSGLLSDFPEVSWEQYRPQGENDSTVPRSALVLRAWEGMGYGPAIKMYIRSLVNELSFHSGGEYDVHLLIEMKNTSRPIWASAEAYNEALMDIVPEEFRSIATLWSQPLMQLVYPGPFQPQFHDHGSMYPAMRSMHFGLQWFMVQHPEYEYIWNWEMDIRYVGHWYELLNTARKWAKRQPRRYAWARSARYYISALYDSSESFNHDTAARAPDDPIDDQKFTPNPTPGHSSNEEEEADFITFNPIFNPENTLWNRREDVTGYDTDQPIPERRSAIVAASRFSRRLLLAMHHENYHNRHSMASEMFPPTMALHHGLKAVYVPHPVYLERDWTAEFAAEVFNGGPNGDTGNYPDSVFGEGPKGNHMALLQSTFYYDAKFAEGLFWRWGGYEQPQYENEGGAKDELKKDKDGVRKGRMCLRSMLFHPIKYDEGRSF